MLNLKSFTLLSLVTLSAMAADADPTVNIIAKKQPDSELTVMGVTIGKTPLEEVKAKFKSKEIHHEGEGAAEMHALCFTGSNGQTLAFESGAQGGNAHVVTSVSIFNRASAYKLNAICEKTPMIKTKLAINNVSLGMSSLLIKRVKGKPSKESANSLYYQFEVHEKGETLSTLTIDFKDNAVSAIVATKTETI